jgi:hypothetical protein
MFITILLNAIIWVAFCKMSFFCSKFTTIAQYEWFQDASFWLEEFAQNKLKSKKLAKWVLNLSYSKAFICRPCHCFWLSWIALYFALRIESSVYAFGISFILALMTHFMAKGLEEKPKQRYINEDFKNAPWTNGRSQYGGYDGIKLK